MKCQLRALVVAGAMLAGLAMPASAAVVTQPLGLIGPPGFSPIGGTVGPGAFTQFFNFTIGAAFNFTASATADATPGNPTAVSVNNFSLAIFNGSGPNPLGQIA